MGSAVPLEVSVAGPPNSPNKPIPFITSEYNLTVLGPPSTISLMKENYLVAGGFPAEKVRFTLDVAASGSELRLTPRAAGLTFNPTTVTVEEMKRTSGSFSITADQGAAAGRMSHVEVTFDGVNIPFPNPKLLVTGNTFQVLVPPSAITIKESTTLIIGGAVKEGMVFVLDHAAEGDNGLMLTPTAEGITVVATTEARQKANNNNNAANALSVSIAIVGLNAPKDGKLEMSGNILAVMTTTTTSTSTTTTTTTTTPSTTTTTSTTTSTS